MEYVGICWNMLEYVGICWNTLEYVGIRWNTLEYVGICWNMLEFVGICWNMLEYVGIGWNTCCHQLCLEKQLIPGRPGLDALAVAAKARENAKTMVPWPVLGEMRLVSKENPQMAFFQVFPSEI